MYYVYVMYVVVGRPINDRFVILRVSLGGFVYPHDPLLDIKPSVSHTDDPLTTPQRPHSRVVLAPPFSLPLFGVDYNKRIAPSSTRRRWYHHKKMKFAFITELGIVSTFLALSVPTIIATGIKLDTFSRNTGRWVHDLAHCLTGGICT